jgi:hypothetical protein
LDIGTGNVVAAVKRLRAEFGLRVVKWISVRKTPDEGEPEDDSHLREMARAGKSITMIALRLKRTVMAVRCRSSLLDVSFRELKQKESPPA